MKKLLVTLTRSKAGQKKNHLANLEALGLAKVGDQVLHEDNAAMRGMCFKVQHLVTVEEVEVEEVEVEAR